MPRIASNGSDRTRGTMLGEVSMVNGRIVIKPEMNVVCERVVGDIPSRVSFLVYIAESV